MRMALARTVRQKLNQKNPLKDFVFFAGVTLVFHFLYWHTQMNLWLFWPFNNSVYSFFTHIAYMGDVFLCKVFYSAPLWAQDSWLRFYTNGRMHTMYVVADCSGIKQLLQFAMIMLVVRGTLWHKGVYFLSGSVLILLGNILRIYLLTIVSVNYSAYYQPIHDWVGRPFHYVLIFCLWVVWQERFAYSKGLHSQPQVAHPKEDLV
jgi:Transmembrane exosortase (Exosortase_EpsH).